MPTLALVNFNIVCATLGGFISLFGLVSYLLKESFYISEPLVSMLVGVTFSPHALNWIRPLEYAQGSEIDLNYITLYFSRLVLGVQLVLAGVQLPSKYLKKEWKSLLILLGPGMTAMWLSSSLLIWGMVPHLTFLHSLAVGACVTPTDPVLSNSIVKGKFADKNIPPPLQKIIIAESGANDGLGYPFLFLALYIIKYNGHDGNKGANEAMRLWFGETWAYTILLSVVYGAAVGWLAKELLHYCEGKKYVDRESFLIFAITLALFIVGTCGMIGSDDVLACFIAGNAFTWDDWFRLETKDDSLQPTIDMLLNISIFAWFGAVCPWPSFRVNNVIPIYRLIPLGILILLLRRIPFVFSAHKYLHQIKGWQQAVYTGFFGPIGVSAVFYLYISLEFLEDVTMNGTEREDAQRLGEVITVVVWFLVMCSVVVHGMSVPLGKFSYHFPRTISQAVSTDNDEPDVHPWERIKRIPREFRRKHHKSLHGGNKPESEHESAPSSGSGEERVGPTFKLGEMRPMNNIVTQRAYKPGTDSQDALEPPRPVVIIDSPMARSPATSRAQSPRSSAIFNRADATEPDLRRLEDGKIDEADESKA